MNNESAPEQKSPLPKLIAIVGPTASGKSHLAIELATRLNGEVISADSVQVYRHFDIGSGKASKEEQARCPHHLLDIVEPTERFEAAQFAERARDIIADLHQKEKVAIICGGTFLWVRALLYGLAPAPAGDPQIRKQHQEFADKHGRAALHEKLALVDQKSAERLHPNDLMRVSRALEVYELTQKTLSSLQAQHGFQTPRYESITLQVAWEREAYEKRLRARITQMLTDGWKDEVEALLAAGYRMSRAMQAVGYKQMLQYIDGEITEAAVLESIVRVTRIFARRQRTWLRDQHLEEFPAIDLQNTEKLDSFAEKLDLWLKHSAPQSP